MLCFPNAICGNNIQIVFWPVTKELVRISKCNSLYISGKKKKAFSISNNMKYLISMTIYHHSFDVYLKYLIKCCFVVNTELFNIRSWTSAHVSHCGLVCFLRCIIWWQGIMYCEKCSADKLFTFEFVLSHVRIVICKKKKKFL